MRAALITTGLGAVLLLGALAWQALYTVELACVRSWTLPCWMSGPGMPVVADPPAGWSPCGASASGHITIWVAEAADCLGSLTVRQGAEIRFVDGRAAAQDLDDDGDIDLRDYALTQNEWSTER